MWSAKIYRNGWKKPGLSTADMTENAPGAKLGEIGIASPLTAGRHLVHERVAEAYAEVLVRKAKALVVGDPFDKKVQLKFRKTAVRSLEG